MTLTVGSLFSGIGGLDLGLERAGCRIAWSCEQDKDCRQVLAQHWPDVTCYPDVKEIDGRVPRVDVLCGGSPCTDWSVAGQRAGLAGERTGLFFEFVRVADLLAPRWLLVENVPGMLSACSCPGCKPPQPDDDTDDDAPWVRPEHRGRDFGVVLAELSGFHPDVPDGGWRSAGFCCGPKRAVAWRLLDAQWFGVAQRRRRVFIVGSAGNWADPAEILAIFGGGDGDTPPSREKGTRVAGTLTAGVASGRGVNPPVIVSTLQGGEDRGYRIDAESAAGGHLIPTTAPALVARYDKGADSDATDALIVADTLRSHPRPSSNTTGAIVAVAYPLAMRGRADGAELEMGEEGVYNALRAGDGGSSRQPMVAYSTKMHNTHSNQSGKFYEEYAPGLQADSPPPVVAYGVSENQRGELLLTDNAHQLTTGGGKPGQGYPAVLTEMAVRRLMPVECERLQGFPDRWTACTADGTPISDSARYRMLGNAVCTNVAEWIGRRIMKAAA